MINRTIDTINERSESYRRKFTFFMSFTVVLLIFSVWTVQKGFVKIGDDPSVASNESQLSSAVVAKSPMDSSKEVFSSTFSDIAEGYRRVKESLSAVLVPFITNIEVYERK